MTVKRRILAVDFGDRRTGLAATDGTGTIVVPLATLHGLADAACAESISATARDRGSEVIVVGLPLDVRGEIGARAQRTLGFVEVLRATAPCPVDTIDETHSTDEAHAMLKSAGLKTARRRQLADSVAAMVICERYKAHTARPR